ncbi:MULTISPECIES: F0F1 ATP synthase subunit epsilon [Ehrlichia]|uniref:ATP synthase, Delta/Epsilon chain, beta-sandwich domain protein n=1 Tax=Ehrlichia cf. muris str. EmCRT TaxID=1359167 RepID=A0A0F3NEB2_9RICK|nr:MULTISPECIES: ATP synthase subunit epsilon [Ehrlichia]KJV66066.1 ATP synthase, Delta/Epsilon chain, beta-sandwich domain protein [Ehrlichia cf. muris str. EmCRT]OUC04721.1 ATP synthase subunit epsilon [Ehrlichia sp. Wisconsin_h]
MKYLSVEFITPDAFLGISNVLSITSYVIDGEFVILPGHEKFIIELCSGLVKIKIDTGVNIFYVLNPILKVDPYNCKIIANQFIDACDINAVMLKGYKEDIEKILNSISDKMLLKMATRHLTFINKIID